MGRNDRIDHRRVLGEEESHSGRVRIFVTPRENRPIHCFLSSKPWGRAIFYRDWSDRDAVFGSYREENDDEVEKLRAYQSRSLQIRTER